MDAFLKQVAAHYWEQAGPKGIGTLRFVFPNRRSGAFFRKYLQEAIASAPGNTPPVFAPEILTINDFFFRICGLEPTDRITLLLELYACYKTLHPKAEPLDEFVFWGDILLGDFDDIDKYRVDARILLTNVADFKSLQDGLSYLSETQRKAVEQFVSHFRGEPDPGQDGEDGKLRVKQRFLQIWTLLHPLYTAFRARLREKGLAYEGMVYRDLAEGETMPEGADGMTVFVGLNALNECEKAVMKRLRDAGKAEFVWDYVEGMISDPKNKSSLFMRDNVHTFPQAFPLKDAPGHVPEIHAISVPSAVGQAKLLPELLRGSENHPIGTAVVLPDETLLMSVLNTIPPQFGDINVTMGFPMQGGAVFSLMRSAAALQLHVRYKDGEALFFHRQVREIFSSSLYRRMLSPEEQASTERILREARYYIPAGSLRSGGPLMDILFRPVIPDPKQPGLVGAIAQWQLELLSVLGLSLSRDGQMLLELDLTKRYYTAVSLLLEQPALREEILPPTWFRLLERLLATQSVPFNGEPLKGLQIMGPLETRALDFERVILLSANEGMFPRRSVASSFIPPELRKGFGLPTYEFQDAVWAYYFYRLLQRAAQVYLLTDCRTEGLHSGEESRYIKQLELYFRVPVIRHTALSTLHPGSSEGSIAKTPEDIEIVRAHPLSATSLNAYLNCPAKFYYQKVCGLRAEEEIADSLDGRMIGNAFHHVMQHLYTGGEALRADFPMDDAAIRRIPPIPELTGTYLRSLMKDEALLREKIAFAVRHEMRSSLALSGRNLVVANVLYEYVRKTLERDIELIERDGAERPIRLLGLEKNLEWECGGFRFIGKIDRLDSPEPGLIRVIDYKTGAVKDEDLRISDHNADTVAGKLFGDKNSARPTIAFQLFIYDRLVHADPAYRDARIENAIYSPAALFTDAVESIPESPRFAEIVQERLEDTLKEIADPAVPFRRTDDAGTCGYCDFKDICGR